MSLQLPFPCALVALVLNGIACACPAMLQVAAAPSHAVESPHHHAVDDQPACDTSCDCNDVTASNSDRYQAARIDTRNTADDGDSPVCCVSTTADVSRALTVHPPPWRRAPFVRVPATPVSRFERMLV